VPAEEFTTSPWWERARRDRAVPAWVQANLRFYDRGTNRARIGYYALETVISALEREVVSWSAELGGYAGPDADERLLLVAQDLVAGETGRWAMLRSREPGAPAVGQTPDS
jgi:hypothetical protein